MEKRVLNKNGRDKKFIGAIVGTVAGLAGNLIGAKKRRKAEEADLKEQQAEQYKLEGIQQAAAMTSQYANQDYVDQYKNKVVLKAGGKMKAKKGNKGDRVEYNKKFAVGGRKKYEGGGTEEEDKDSSDGDINVGQEALDALPGVIGLGMGIFGNPQVSKKVKKNPAFGVTTPKTTLDPTSYQVDANGVPITTINNNIPIDGLTGVNPIYKDRLLTAKAGGRFKQKSK